MKLLRTIIYWLHNEILGQLVLLTLGVLLSWFFILIWGYSPSVRLRGELVAPAVFYGVILLGIYLGVNLIGVCFGAGIKPSLDRYQTFARAIRIGTSEELLFRGVIFGYLALSSLWVAHIVNIGISLGSAFIYSLSSTARGALEAGIKRPQKAVVFRGIVQSLPELTLGIALALLYLRYRSLLTIGLIRFFVEVAAPYVLNASYYGLLSERVSSFWRRRKIRR